MIFLMQLLHPVYMLLFVSQHSHMDMPEGGVFFYLILIISSVIVIAVTIWTVKLIFWPGETSPDHIKHKILED